LSGQYWAKGEGPADYEQLVERYDSAYDGYFEKTLRHFGLDEEADLWRDQRDEFDNLYEAGRRSTFDRISPEDALLELATKYEAEAAAAEAGGAYLAACVMISSAAETRLLLTAIARASERNLAMLQLARQPRSRDPYAWSLDTLVDLAAAAKWIEDVLYNEVTISPLSFLDELRSLRNLVHPGRYAKRNFHAELGRQSYEGALATYRTLRQQLEKLAPL